MIRHILLVFALIATFNFMPVMQNTASAMIELNDVENFQVKIKQEGNAVVVTGALGKTVCVYNLIGVEIMRVKIDSHEKTIDLSHLKKGIYPVKVGNITKKIYVGDR